MRTRNSLHIVVLSALVACGGRGPAGDAAHTDGGGLALGPGAGGHVGCTTTTQVDVPVACDAGAAEHADVSAGSGDDAATTPSAGDGGPAVSPDAGPTLSGPDGGLATSGTEICHVEWDQPGALTIFPVQAVVDGAGNTYMAVDYVTYQDPPYPSLNFGLSFPPNQGGFAVAKIDDDCKLVWAREFGTTGGGAEYDAIGIDAAGNLSILGTYVGPVDLGAGTVSQWSTQNVDGFLLRLDTNGKNVFLRTFVTGHVDAMIAYDVAVTPAGVSTIALNAGADVDFGGGVDLAGALSGGAITRFDVVQYDATGALLWQEQVSSLSSSVDEILGLATNSTGSLWASGWKLGSGNYQPVLLGLSSTGGLNWLQNISPGGPALAAGAKGAVSMDESSSVERLTAYAADGTSPWTQTIVPTIADQSSGLFSTRIAVDAAGNAIVGGTVSGSVTIPSAPTLVSAGGEDVAYQAFDGQGHVVSVGRWGGPDQEVFGGVGSDPSGNILIGGLTNPPNTANTSATERIFMVKLAR